MRQTVLARLMESQIWYQLAGSMDLWLCGSGEEGFRKGTMASAHLSVWEKVVPQLLPQCQTLQFLPVCHCCLSNCYLIAESSEGVSLSKSVCVCFKRNCLGLQKFLSMTQSLLVSPAGSYGDLPSWHWEPGLGGLVWGWDSSFLRYPSRIFMHHT